VTVATLVTGHTSFSRWAASPGMTVHDFRVCLRGTLAGGRRVLHKMPVADVGHTATHP
jgi:hypothetical protein